MSELNKQTEQKIQQLQMIEQSINNLLSQKQQFQSQLIEIDSALTEMKDTNEVYKIVGNIMVKGEKEKLKKDLDSKKEIVELRIKTIEKQEKDIKEKAKNLQSEVLKEMENGDKND